MPRMCFFVRAKKDALLNDQEELGVPTQIPKTAPEVIHPSSVDWTTGCNTFSS